MRKVKLNEIASIQYGKNLPTKKLLKSGYPVFGANGQIGFYENYLFEKEQLMISCRGAYSGKINFSSKQCYITNNSLIVDFPIFKKELKRYFFYILQSANKSKLVTGTAQPQVTINNANELEIPLPPLPEQKAIVAKIEQLFSDLDNGIANLKKAKDQLKIYRQAVLKKAFEGELTKEWRENNFGTRSKYNWVCDFLKNKSTKITKGSTPTTYGFKYQTKGINFIKVENIINGKINTESISQFISQDAYHFQKRSQLEENDILFSIAGTIGNTAIVRQRYLPANTNQAIAIIKGFDEYILPEYLLYQLRSFIALKVKSKARGGAMNNISLGDLKLMEILIPQKLEQKQILIEIETRLSVCDNVEANIKEALIKAESLRQSILKKAFEGKLLTETELQEVRNHPEWEPAEKLLEKIKAEKAKSSSNKRGK